MPRKPASWRTDSTTSCEVFPDGLSITRIPSTGGCLGMRDMNGLVKRPRAGLAAQARYLLYTRCEVESKSQRAADNRGAKLRTVLLGIFGLAQQVLDAIVVFFRFIQDEQHFWRAPHVQTLHQFVPHVAFRRLQAFQRRGAFRLVARQSHKHAHRAHSGAQAYFGDHHGSRQARIFELSREHQAHFVANFFRDAFGPVSLNCHALPSSWSSKYSTFCESKSRPNRRSDSAAISASVFSR